MQGGGVAQRQKVYYASKDFNYENFPEVALCLKKHLSSFLPFCLLNLNKAHFFLFFSDQTTFLSSRCLVFGIVTWLET